WRSTPPRTHGRRSACAATRPRTTGRGTPAQRTSRAATTSAKRPPSQRPGPGRDRSDCAGSWRTSAEIAKEQKPEQRRGEDGAEEYDPAAQARLLALQAVARVPGQVPRAVEQVIEECKRESDQQQPDQRMHEEDPGSRVG